MSLDLPSLKHKCDVNSFLWRGSGPSLDEFPWVLVHNREGWTSYILPIACRLIHISITSP